MADSITDNTALLAAELITRSEFDRLNTYERDSDSWASVHKRAWTEVKKDLLKRRTRTEESDLDDTSELEDATLYKVLEIAYRTSDVEGDRKQAGLWRASYLREMAEIELTVNGVTLASEGQLTAVYRG